MIKTIDGHSFDIELLSTGGWALDVGARGFGFSNRMAELGLNVIALEPDRTVQYRGPFPSSVCCLNVALVAAGGPAKAMYAGWSNGEGNHLTDRRPDHATDFYAVPCITIESLMDQWGIEQFDIVKLDCEGSEYDILWTWPNRAAVQISVEFHDFLGKCPWPAYYHELFDGPLADYEIVQHTRTPLNASNPVMNYWDSLFSLKSHV